MIIEKGAPHLKISNASHGCIHTCENLKRLRVAYDYIIL